MSSPCPELRREGEEEGEGVEGEEGERRKRGREEGERRKRGREEGGGGRGKR